MVVAVMTLTLLPTVVLLCADEDDFDDHDLTLSLLLPPPPLPCRAWVCTDWTGYLFPGHAALTHALVRSRRLRIGECEKKNKKTAVDGNIGQAEQSRQESGREKSGRKRYV